MGNFLGPYRLAAGEDTIHGFSFYSYIHPETGTAYGYLNFTGPLLLALPGGGEITRKNFADVILEGELTNKSADTLLFGPGRTFTCSGNCEFSNRRGPSGYVLTGGTYNIAAVPVSGAIFNQLFFVLILVGLYFWQRKTGLGFTHFSRPKLAFG
jgi:hypothetical protein